MFNKTGILGALDAFLESTKDKLSIEEIEFLSWVRQEIAEAKQEEELLDGLIKLIQFMLMIHEIFGNK